jgi:hypothetical protein
MHQGARTPEQLEMLLEDTFVIHDRRLLAALFEPGAVLSAGDQAPAARGRVEIVRAAEAMWARDELYLTSPSPPVLQTRTTALIAGQSATSVARRSPDGAWRYAIALLHTKPQLQRSTT